MPKLTPVSECSKGRDVRRRQVKNVLVNIRAMTSVASLNAYAAELSRFIVTLERLEPVRAIHIKNLARQKRKELRANAEPPRR